MLPEIDLSGRPNPDATYGGAILLSSLGGESSVSAQELATFFGATVDAWHLGSLKLWPRFSVLRQGDNVWVGVYGTTNAPQWVNHVGSTVLPLPDLTIGTTVNWSFGVGYTSIIADVLSAANLSPSTNLMLFGHSYGAAVAYLLGCAIARQPLRPAKIQLLTFGEPRSWCILRPPVEPDIHFKLADPFDVVLGCPPGFMLLAGVGRIVSLTKLLGQFHWQSSGQLRQWNGIDFEITSPDPREGFLAEVSGLADATVISHHAMATSYLPKSKTYWFRNGGSPALAALDPVNNFLQGLPITPPPLIGDPPSVNIESDGWFPGVPTSPITSANQPFLETITPHAFLHKGSSSMSQMKGTFLFNLGNGGFSESVYAVGKPSLDYLGMMSLMKGLLPYRMAMSMSAEKTQTTNPLTPYAIRVEDELVARDSLDELIPALPIPTGFYNTPPLFSAPKQATHTANTIYLQNYPDDIAAKVKFRGATGLQTAGVYFHGMPILGYLSFPYSDNDFGFRRNAPIQPTMLGYMKTYCDQLNSLGLGYRFLKSPQDDPNTGKPLPVAVPVAITFNSAADSYDIELQYAPPAQRARYVLRGFKQLRFLNGRRVGIKQVGNVIRIAGRYPDLFTPGPVPWDGNGYVSVETWDYFIPNKATVPVTGTLPGISYKFLGKKAIGRPFGLDRGKAGTRT